MSTKEPSSPSKTARTDTSILKEPRRRWVPENFLLDGACSLSLVRRKKGITCGRATAPHPQRGRAPQHVRAQPPPAQLVPGARHRSLRHSHDARAFMRDNGAVTHLNYCRPRPKKHAKIVAPPTCVPKVMVSSCLSAPSVRCKTTLLREGRAQALCSSRRERRLAKRRRRRHSLWHVGCHVVERAEARSRSARRQRERFEPRRWKD